MSTTLLVAVFVGNAIGEITRLRRPRHVWRVEELLVVASLIMATAVLVVVTGFAEISILLFGAVLAVVAGSAVGEAARRGYEARQRRYPL